MFVDEALGAVQRLPRRNAQVAGSQGQLREAVIQNQACLLYTSDAADE